ncbi:MAG: tetratricopeptide repeat protein [Saprospiraceae bacterium]|nr:tetratricopeptide repeat protein [Saprospiraceae bacterium]
MESNEAVSWALKSDNPHFIFTAYRRLGRVLEDIERLPEASEKYYKALEVSFKLPVATQLDIMIDWAIINKKLGNYKISKDYYETALNIAFQIKDMEMVDFAFNGLGTLHATVGEYDLALDAYLRSKKLSEERADTSNIIKSLNNISEAYLKAKNYDLAIENTQEAYSYALLLHDSSKLCRVLNIHGKILTSTKDYHGAIKKHEEALSICQFFDNKKQYFLTLVLLADAHTQLEQLNKAEFYLEKCLAINEKVDNYDLPNYYFKLGELYRLQNKNNEARKALQTCIRYAEIRKLKDVLQKAYDALAKTYYQQQNYSAAFTYLTLAKRFSDSLYNDENARRMAEARYKFDIERSEKEIQDRNEKKLETVKWERNRFMTIIFSLCFTFIIVVMAFFLRDKNQNNLYLKEKPTK